MAEVVGAFLASQHDLGRITEELADRYQEIDLLYTISELLGQKISFRETAKNILREVSTMVSARRASILVHDEASGFLDIAATWGVRPEQLTPVTADDALSIAARVFREERMVVVNAEDANTYWSTRTSAPIVAARFSVFRCPTLLPGLGRAASVS